RHRNRYALLCLHQNHAWESPRTLPHTLHRGARVPGVLYRAMACADSGLLTSVCYDKLPRACGDPTPDDGEENEYGNPRTLFDHTLWRLLSPRCPTGRHRTHA